MKTHGLVLALTVALAIATSSSAAPGTPALKKGLWSYSGDLVVSLDGKKLQAATKTWQFCARHAGEPPLIMPEGDAEIRCGKIDTSPIAGGYHASRTCTATTDDKVSTILEDFVVLPGSDGLTSTMRGSVSTGISGQDTSNRPLTVDVASKGHWVGDCQ